MCSIDGTFQTLPNCLPMWVGPGTTLVSPSHSSRATADPDTSISAVSPATGSFRLRKALAGTPSYYIALVFGDWRLCSQQPALCPTSRRRGPIDYVLKEFPHGTRGLILTESSRKRGWMFLCLAALRTFYPRLRRSMYSERAQLPPAFHAAALTAFGGDDYLLPWAMAWRLRPRHKTTLPPGPVWGMREKVRGSKSGVIWAYWSTVIYTPCIHICKAKKRLLRHR